MARLDNYRSALLATFASVSDEDLDHVIDDGGPALVSIIVDYGLGPVWHERTNRQEFRTGRLAAEAQYLAQQNALHGIDAALTGAGISYAVVKGVATRVVLFDNPAIRACYDIDLLVLPEDRVRAANALEVAGFAAIPKTQNIDHELLLSDEHADIDLHWGLFREGRLRHDVTAAMLKRRRREKNVWMLNAEDTLFVLLVHPAFAKHLAGWGMGLHRVVDVAEWIRTQTFDWQRVTRELSRCGVKTAAWTTLRWVQLLTMPHTPKQFGQMMKDIQPGRLRRAWLDYWLRNDLSQRTSSAHWARLIGFSVFLHDRPADAWRAVRGRHRAHRRRQADMAVFQDLSESAE